MRQTRPAARLIIRIALLFGLLSSTAPASLLAQSESNAAGREISVWRYAFLDDPYNALLEQDDSTWQSVSLPANLSRLGARADQAVWLRARVQLNASREQNHALYLGSVFDEDRVYFNGEQIGRNGPIQPGSRGQTIDGYGRPRIYPIPDQLVQDGENLIAIRITGQFPNAIGVLDGPVRVQPLRAAEWHLWRHQLRGLVLSAIYAMIGIFFLILNQKLPAMREYRWFGFFAIACGLQQFLVNEIRFAPAFFEDLFTPFKLVEQLCYVLIPTLYFWFHLHFFKVERVPSNGSGRSYSLKRIGTVYTIVNLLTGLGLIAVMSRPVLRDLIIGYWFWINIPFFLYYVIFTVRRALRTGERDAVLLSFGGVAILLVTLHFHLVERGFFEGPHYIRVGMAVFILALAFALIYRLIALQLEVDQRSRRLDTVNVLRDRVFNYLNTFVRKPTDSISATADLLLQSGNGHATSLIQSLDSEVDQLQTNLDDILELSRLEVINDLEYVEQVNFHDFITAVIPQGVITHHIKVSPDIVLNTSLELVNSLVIRLIDFPAFREFKHIDLIITSDLKAHVHFRFLMFHDNVRQTRQLYELLTGLNPERGHLWVKWAIVREIIRILNGHLDINILNRKFLRIDIELSGESAAAGEAGNVAQQEIKVEYVDPLTVADGLRPVGADHTTDAEQVAVARAVVARPTPKLSANMTVDELWQYLKSRFSGS